MGQCTQAEINQFFRLSLGNKTKQNPFHFVGHSLKRLLPLGIDCVCSIGFQKYNAVDIFFDHGEYLTKENAELCQTVQNHDIIVFV